MPTASMFRPDHSTGTRSHGVPQPRPRYAPRGYRRCDRCNALVPDGRRCPCAAVDMDNRSSAVVTSRMDAADMPPSRPRHSEWYEGEKAKEQRESDENGPRSRDTRKHGKHTDNKRKDGYRPKTERAECSVCGEWFERRTDCRPARMCQTCRKLPVSMRQKVHRMREDGC